MNYCLHSTVHTMSCKVAVRLTADSFSGRRLAYSIFEKTGTKTQQSDHWTLCCSTPTKITRVHSKKNIQVHWFLEPDQSAASCPMTNMQVYRPKIHVSNPNIHDGLPGSLQNRQPTGFLTKNWLISRLHEPPAVNRTALWPDWIHILLPYGNWNGSCNRLIFFLVY